MKKYLDEGTINQQIVSVKETDDIFAIIIYVNGEEETVLISRLTDLNSD